MSKRREKRLQGITPTAPLPGRPSPESTIDDPVTVSFRYIEPGRKYCLSKCTRDQVRLYKDCLRILTTMAWKDVLKTGGKRKNKAGLGYTPYSDDSLRTVNRPCTLDQEIKISGVRAGKGSRLFGAYHKHVYYILWFDPNHKIVKG